MFENKSNRLPIVVVLGIGYGSFDALAIWQSDCHGSGTSLRLNASILMCRLSESFTSSIYARAGSHTGLLGAYTTVGSTKLLESSSGPHGVEDAVMHPAGITVRMVGNAGHIVGLRSDLRQ